MDDNALATFRSWRWFRVDSWTLSQTHLRRESSLLGLFRSSETISLVCLGNVASYYFGSWLNEVLQLIPFAGAVLWIQRVWISGGHPDDALSQIYLVSCLVGTIIVNLVPQLVGSKVMIYGSPHLWIRFAPWERKKVHAFVWNVMQQASARSGGR